MNEQTLKDFIATAQKYNYDWNTVFGKFPELKGYNKQVLKDYVATAEKNNYDYDVVNAKFPELKIGGQPLKKKEVSQSTQKQKATSLDGSNKATKQQSVSSNQQGNYSLPGEYLDYPGKGIRRYYDGKWYDYGFTETKNGKEFSVYDKDITDPNRITTLNKKFNKTASLDPIDKVYSNYDEEKKDNQYRINNGNWERKVPGAMSWSTVTNEGSVGALNRRYGKDVKYKPELKTVKQEPKLQFADINTSLVSKTEENAVDVLAKKYSKYGFTFEQTGFGTDYVTVYNKDKSKELTVGFDEKNPEEALKLRNFLEQNASKEKSNTAIELENKIKTLNSGFINFDEANKTKNFIIRPETVKYVLSDEYKDKFSNLSFDEMTEQINKSIKPSLGIKDLEKFYNSETYKIYKNKKKEEFGARDARIDLLYTELQSAKASGNKAAQKNIKSKITAFLTDDVIQDQVKNYSMQLNDLDNAAKKLANDQKKYAQSIETFNKKSQSGQMSQEEFDQTKKMLDEQAESLSTRADFLMSSGKSIQKNQKKLNVIAGKYVTEKAKAGSFGGGIVNSFLTGFSKAIVEAPATLAISVQGAQASDDYDKLSPEEKQFYKNKGYSREQTKNLLVNERLKDFKSESRKVLVDAIGADQTTKEYMKSADRGFFEKAIYGVAESTPAMLLSLINPTASFTGLAAQSYSSIEDEMLDDPDFATSSVGERAMISVPYSLVMGVLENYGLKNVVKGESFAGGVVKNILAKSISKMPKNATREVLQSIIDKEVKSLIGKGLLKIANGAIAEFETGATQSLVLDVGLKSLYNKVKQSGMTEEEVQNLSGGEFFATPDTVGDVFSTVLEDGLAEAIGGATIGTFSTVASGLKNGNISLYDEKDLDYLKEISQDSEFKKLIVSNLKTEMLKGNLTKSEAQERLDAMNELTSVMESIPEELNAQDQIDAVNMLSEKNRLTKEIQGKDPALVTAQTERINEINEELKTISKNAVQVETTGEVPVQPEAAVGREVAQGESQAEPQVAAQESKAVQEVIDRRRSLLSETEQKKMDENPIEYARQSIKESIDSYESKQDRSPIEDDILNDLKNDYDVLTATEEDAKAKEILPQLANAERTLVQLGKNTNPNNTDEVTYTDLSDTSVKDDFTPFYKSIIDYLKKNDEVTIYDKANNKTYKFKLDGNTLVSTKVPNVKAAPVVQQAPVAQPAAQPTVRQTPQKNLVTSENVDQLRAQQTTPVAQKIYTAAKLAMKALPGVKVYVHNTTADFDQGIGEKSSEGSKGAYVDGEIHINLENGADVVTMLHEAMHHALVVKGVESGAMLDLAKGLKSVVSDKALKQRLDNFISGYDASETAEEYIAELGGIMAEAQQELTTTKFQQFKNLINKLAQKLGLPTVFSAAANAKNAVDFMNSLTKSIRTGQEIKTEEVKKTGKVKFQADFSDPLSKLTFVYDKNGEKFDQLKKEGYITDDKNLSDFAGKIIFLHQPDAAFSGTIYKDGELLVEGKGGVFYPIKFHDDGYFWASTKDTAKKMAEDLNKVFEQNNGTIYMALTSAPYDKLMSSTTMANAVLDFFSSKAFDKNFSITPTQLKTILNSAANATEEKKTLIKKDGVPVLDKKGNKQYKIKIVGLGTKFKINKSDSIDTVTSRIKELLNPDITSFEDRKTFAEELIRKAANIIKSNPKSVEQFGKLFSEGIQNKYFKGISKTGKISISAANMTQAISEMFTEPLLKEDINRKNGGQVYAIVELNGKVEPVDSDKHESYPKAIQSENKNNKVKIHILQDRQNWADVFIDPETGETISKDRQKKLFPTSGVSTMGLELKGKPKFQKGETKESKINIYGQDFTDLFKELGIPFEYLADIKDKNIPDFLGGKNKKITELRDSLLKSINYRLDLLKEDLEKQSRKITNSDSDFEFRRSLINKKTDKVLSLERLKSSIEENLLSESDIEISIGNKPSKPKFQKTAPNGKPSNLNDKQWNQVRTPEFKKWFGDWENDPVNASKVVDENGEPLMTYHGSKGGFDEFKTEYLGGATGADITKMGFFFTNNENVAKTFQFISQEPNIDELTKIVSSMSYDEMVEFNDAVMKTRHFRKGGEITGEDDESYEDFLKDIENDSQPSNSYDSFGYMGKVVDFLKSKGIEFNPYVGGEMYKVFLNIRNPFEIDANGDLLDNSEEISYDENKYDGVIVKNTLDSIPLSERDGGIESDVFITKNPKAIKSATENVGTFSTETRNIKFQKANTQQEAIQKAKEKYILSVDQRGNPHKQGVDAALNDLRKSDWYKNTDDTQRENAERELKEFFGEKLKKAPSVAKILGKPKPKKVTVNEMTAYKNELRLQAKAAREAKGDLNAKRKALAAAISGMVKLGKIKAAQAGVLIKRISNLNLDNPVLVERFVNYAAKVFERSDYQQRLDDAFKLRKSIRKALKTDNQAEVVGMAKEFANIDPSMVDDIDTYIAMAEKVANAVKPSRVKGLDVVMKEAANIAEVSEYTNQEITRQEDIQKQELLATYDFLDNEMSLKDMQDVINALKDPTSQMDTTEKEKYVKDYLNGRFGIMSSILDTMLKTGIDPMTGEEITFDEKQKELIKRALNIDLNEMSVRDAIKIVESLENFITNQITSGLEAAVSSYEGAVNAKSLVARGKKAKSLRLFFSNYVGKIYSEQLFSLPMLMEKMFGGVTNSLNMMNKMGLIKLINGVNKANRQHNDILDQYSKQPFYSTKNALGKYVMNKDFMDAENVYERGMLAFLKRNLIGSPTEMKAEFERRVRMIQESINKLIEDGDSKEQKMGELYQKIYDKLGVSEMDMDVINSNASKNNLDAVNWWVNQWSQHYSDLSDISLSVYNTQLGSDLNYTPDKYKRLSSENQSLDEGAVERNGAFAISIDYTDKNKTGVLMETTRPNVMPDGRYISLDFDTNNSKALKSALTDINTASAIRQVDGFINSKSFKKLIPESEDRAILTKRINSYIRRAKGKNVVPSDTIQYLNKLVNFATALGVGKALGGINQAVSQTIPVMVNTVVNAGRFDFAGADFNAWLNESGLPISNRGLESQSTVQSIDRKIDMKGTGVQEALKSVTDLNQWYLKQFLVKPDVFVARSSFKSYYLQNLKRRGISTDIDWTTHKMDMEAAEYAQAMIDRQQNISDPMLAGEFLSSDDPIKQIARKIVLPFASFILNQKARMYNDFQTIASKTATKEDKIIAFRSLAGLGAELAAYQMIGFGIRRLYDMIAASLLGDDDDEETKKKKLINATKYPVKSIVNDIVSPIPMMDGLTTWGLNQSLAQYPWMSDKEIKDAVNSRNKVLELKGEYPMDEKTEAEYINKIKEEAKYQVFEDEFDRSYGMIGIAGSTYQELGEIGKLATTGEFTDEYQGRETTKKLLESDRKKVAYAVPFMVAYSTGLLPKDIGSIGRNYVNRIKKKAVTEKQYERYDAVQKELGRNLKSWEVELIKNKKESETAISEIEFIERNGGLTERQGREYIKVMKAIGEPGIRDIIDIKDGKTADQILK